MHYGLPVGNLFSNGLTPAKDSEIGDPGARAPGHVGHVRCFSNASMRGVRLPARQILAGLSTSARSLMGHPRANRRLSLSLTWAPSPLPEISCDHASLLIGVAAIGRRNAHRVVGYDCAAARRRSEAGYRGRR